VSRLLVSLREMFSRTLLAIAALLVWRRTSEVDAKPHILLMVLDDIGRADTGIYGRSNIPMPNLNGLAKDGVVLESFYTQTVCSPTRSSLMTGVYPFRFGMQHFTVSLSSRKMIYCHTDQEFVSRLNCLA
jgi:arylsulfatase A-like enzyme